MDGVRKKMSDKLFLYMLEVRVVLMDNLEIEKISMTSIKNNPNTLGSGKFACLLYDGCPFYIALLSTSFLYGAINKKNDFNEKEYWSVICTLNPLYLEKMKELDRHVLALSKQCQTIEAVLDSSGRSQTPIDSKPQQAVKKDITKFYNPVLKPINSFEMQNTIKINLQSDFGSGFQCSFYQNNINKPQLILDSNQSHPCYIKNYILPKSSGAILFGMKLWLNSSGFGVNFRAEEIKIDKIQNVLSPEQLCLLDGNAC